ncbi:MAG TPA: hypothetical protein VJR89_41165, partial [Polyangiales bacterium]|nr:hypothetical protein [Polyangiales bacterium]
MKPCRICLGGYLTGVRMATSRKVLLGGLVVVVLLVGARLALPYVVLRYVNKTLDELPGYSGSVADIDISLWRGAYQIKGLRVVKTGGHVPVPFVSAWLIDLS